MQKLQINFSGYSPKETDRLIAVLFQYLKAEKSEIHLELGTSKGYIVHFPVSSCSAEPVFFSIPANSILYVTSDRHYCDFHLKSGVRRERMNFGSVKTFLPQEEFVECNRGVLLSLNNIDEQTADAFVMSDGAHFSIRTKHKKEIIRKYESYRLLHG